MTLSRVDSRSHKVEVRKYILVSRPSRWNQRGDRIVVQSPILNLDNTLFQIPVKRFSGEEENSVCFLPITDIEKDTNSIYEKLRVSKTPHWTEAHGVALFDSPQDEKPKYRYGDRFWICIGPNTNQYENTVPVINLQTFEEGVISIDQACWYPKFKGPNNELWTLGGEKRKLKHCGSKKFTFWSWVICQKLDGSFPTTKNAEVPSKEAKMVDRFELSSSERRSAYEELYQKMVNIPRIASHMVASLNKHSVALMTPPLSPDLEFAKTPSASGARNSIQSQNSVLFEYPNWWKGTMEMIAYGNGQLPLRPSPVHLRILSVPGNLQNRHGSPPSHVRLDLHEGPALESISDFSVKCQPLPQVTNCNGKPFSPELAHLDGPDLLGVSILMEFHRAGRAAEYPSVEPEKATRHLFSVTDPGILSGSTSISQLHQEERATERFRQSERAYIASLCDLNLHDCKYSSLVPYKHYHPPEVKCFFTIYKSKENAPHEHCISRSCALPDRAGSCILSTMPSRNHTCCFWKEEDRADWPAACQKICDERRFQEARINRLKVLDRRNRVREPPLQLYFGEGFHESLDGQGRQMFMEDLLRTGLLSDRQYM